MHEDDTCITAVIYKPRNSALFLIDNIIFVCEIKGIGNEVILIKTKCIPVFSFIQ